MKFLGRLILPTLCAVFKEKEIELSDAEFAIWNEETRGLTIGSWGRRFHD
ncbi:MAG: hypothetical protein ACI8UO_000361 [Verrucomicrobiales bacterium]|jgi:hypothetical protein